MWLRKKRKKKLKSLVRFHSANKIENYNRGGEILKNLPDKSKHNNNKCFSWLTAVRVLSLTGSHSPLHLPTMPSKLYWYLDLLWGQLRFQSAPAPLCSCLPCPQLSELVHFLLWELSMTFYTFHRHSVCLVDRVGLICSLYSWWEGLGLLH